MYFLNEKAETSEIRETKKKKEKRKGKLEEKKPVRSKLRGSVLWEGPPHNGVCGARGHGNAN